MLKTKSGCHQSILAAFPDALLGTTTRAKEAQTKIRIELRIIR